MHVSGIPHRKIEEHIYHLLFQKKPLLAERIKLINLDNYQLMLENAYLKAVDVAKQKSCTAIYFEYNLDNGWQSDFFICPYYIPQRLYSRVNAPNDWACFFLEEVIEGPSLSSFADMYVQDNVGGEVKAYLVARTVAVFDKVFQKYQTDKFAICMAFHDQDPIIRIHEIEPPREKIFDAEKHKLNPIPKVEFNPLEKYILSHYSKLLDNRLDVKQSIQHALIMHAEKIYINHCPFCGALRRTPKAKQCPSCYERECVF